MFLTRQRMKRFGDPALRIEPLKLASAGYDGAGLRREGPGGQCFMVRDQRSACCNATALSGWISRNACPKDDSHSA